ncbi:hypothetical protein [Pseudomonas sp. CCC3.1]|uniref:hypothetical protein n=1 Tax=Pseudomonas sp. CCC3.1 TaxID=3048607 RepID=UPI002AC9966C|nr:hypothetical protein [Pseudomonas sp. CCC3.1]MEB0204926.1 hypothetical protein [Pseudomonas sp. CCC3.1]WPX36428.1 hypothetical protein RHM56_24765 [Pseudomonas sp. CCC3.1]
MTNSSIKHRGGAVDFSVGAAAHGNNRHAGAIRANQVAMPAMLFDGLATGPDSGI